MAKRCCVWLKKSKKEKDWRHELERRRRIQKKQKQVEEETGRRAQSNWKHEPEMWVLEEGEDDQNENKLAQLPMPDLEETADDPNIRELYEMLWDTPQDICKDSALDMSPQKEFARDEFEKKLFEAEEIQEVEGESVQLYESAMNNRIACARGGG